LFCQKELKDRRKQEKGEGEGGREGGRLLVWVAWFFLEGIEIQLGIFYILILNCY
jgi:hypothetical protein